MDFLAQRIETKFVTLPDFPYDRGRLNGPRAVINFVRKALEDSDVEKALVLFLDVKNALVGVKIYEGTGTETAVYIREVAKTALLTGANGVVMVHNHPAGGCRPSDPDILLTTKLAAALALIEVQLRDHIIIGKKHYFSFSKQTIDKIDQKGVLDEEASVISGQQTQDSEPGGTGQPNC